MNTVEEALLVSQLSLRIPGGPGAPAEARRALRRFHTLLPSELMQTVTLLASELVTNAVLHGRGEPVGVSYGVLAECVRVEVVNEGPSFDRTRNLPEPGQAGGWGLYMVEELSSRWGVREGPGTRVWFEIDR
jgi:anti-sigma regulatory factor (Ser/Thr protein kinase)